MRVRIIFNLQNKGGILPFHHQYLLAQLVKGLLMRGGDPNMVAAVNYNFSGVKGQTKVSRAGLQYFSSRVTVVFATDHEELLVYLLKQLFDLPQVEVGGLFLKPEKVELEHPLAAGETLRYVCISPLVVKMPGFMDAEAKRFLHPDSEEFTDGLYVSTLQRMTENKAFAGKDMEAYSTFECTPDQEYLERLDQQQKKFARIYPVYDNDVKYEVRGYTLPFQLIAHPDVHDFVWTNGLGLYTHKGFGMLDVPDTKKTTEEYTF